MKKATAQFDGSLRGFSDNSLMTPLRLYRRLTIYSPSTSAMTILEDLGLRERSTMSVAPSKIPAPIMESPLTVKKKVAGGLAIKRSFRSSVFCS